MPTRLTVCHATSTPHIRTRICRRSAAPHFFRGLRAHSHTCHPDSTTARHTRFVHGSSRSQMHMKPSATAAAEEDSVHCASALASAAANLPASAKRRHTAANLRKRRAQGSEGPLLPTKPRGRRKPAVRECAGIKLVQDGVPLPGVPKVSPCTPRAAGLSLTLDGRATLSDTAADRPHVGTHVGTHVATPCGTPCGTPCHLVIGPCGSMAPQ